jgi:hypothetical protein
MTKRSQLRAAARKAAKPAKKQESIKVQSAAAGQMQNSDEDGIPPSRLDPFPPRPVPSEYLDPLEEGDFEVSEFHLRRIDREVTEHRAKQAAKQAEKKPISEAQLAANQANAKLSTGAVTPEGKAASSRNNFRHGLTYTEGDLALLPDENKNEYLQALEDFQKEWKPATATEHDLVGRLAARQWLRRRAARIQLSYADDHGRVFNHQQYELYRRYEATHDRAFNKALADLMRLRSLQIREKNGFESQRRKEAEHDFKIRALQHREKLFELAIRTAEAKLQRIQTSKIPPNH